MIEKKVLEYFGGDELAASVFLRKYSFKVNGKPTETPQDLFHRLAKEFTRIDMKYDNRITEDKLKLLSPFGQDYFGERAGTDREKAYYLEYLSLLNDFRYIVPQGSGLSGIGLDTPISLSNCFFNGQMEDNIESIYDIAKSMAQVGKRRGGTSTDISLIRPRGAKIDNSANTSSGPTPFLDLLDVTGKIIGQEGRKMAMMVTQDIRHPDVLEFITIKEDLSKVTSANLSTKINKEFLDAVEADKDYFLRYPVEAEIPEHIADILIEDDAPYNELVVVNKNLIEGVQYIKRVKATELWDAIIYSAWKSAEPGILMWDNVIDYDPTSVYPSLKPKGTNPCSELPLGDLDSCRLLFTNLYSLISNKFTKDAKFEKEAAYNIFYTAQVMADNLVDLELEAVDRILTKINPKYAEVKHDVTYQWLSLQSSEFMTWWNIKKIGQNGRRTGTGLSGLADWYAAQGIDYGEPTALHELMDIKFRAEMDASIDLAILRGPFPLWENSLEYDGMEWEITGTNYWYRMLLQDYPDIAHRMSEHGRRNSGLSTIAPTGTTSIVAKISSGMEPVFKISYVRRTKIDENDTTTKVDFVDTNGVKWREHNVLHPAFREWLKLEYSSTLSDKKIDELSEKEIKIYFSKSPWFGNTAEDIDWEDRVKTQGILQKYITSSISSTINLPEDVDIEVIDSLYKLASKEGLKGLTVYREGSRSGVLVSKDKIVLSERPESIPCKIIRFMHEKTQWVAFVGLLNDSPYEIFTGINNLEIFPVPTHIEEGSIIKVTTSEGSRYDFRYEDTYGNINTVGGLNSIFNREFWNYARFTSALLRENVGLPSIIQIIDKLKFDNDSLNSWKSGIIRTLRYFIEDGTKIEGAKCPNPECGSTQVEFKEGCLTCMNCGNSNCS